MVKQIQNQQKLRLLIDMDAVSADILADWLPMINRDYGENLTKESLVEWNIHHCSKAGEKVFDYIHQPGFFVNLKPIPYAVETLKKLHEEGFEIFYVTAPVMDSPHVFHEKIEWIKKHTPFISLDHVIFAQRKDLIDGDILFDDAPKNLESFPGIPVAFDYNFNKHLDVDRVAGWLEFYDLVHKIQREKDANKARLDHYLDQDGGFYGYDDGPIGFNCDH